MRSSEFVVERLVPLQGGFNVRDLGGYPAAGGKRVRQGAVYRSGALNSLTDADLRVMEKLGVKTIVDFRSAQEREHAPHRLPDTVKAVHELSISAGDIASLTDFTLENGAELMRRINRKLVDAARAQYAEFFRLLSSTGNMPLLFNCSAGKDRTGLGAALLLCALGVEREIIYEDYLLSAKFVRGQYNALARKHPNLAAALTVERPYLEAAFDEMDSRFGGPEAYLERQLGVDAGLLRSLYTV